ncbi:MAG: zf-HC2 domain-containing protein [Phycisphaerae bacterium]|nr:zf-HC2 domain-containing protein [Phycisphaerae bacterium]
MTCREVFEFLADYTAGELPTAQREVFERHLSLCPPCVAYVESYRTTIQAGRKAFDDPEFAPNAPIPEELVRAILASRSRGENS